MRYPAQLQEAVFLRRYKRFLVDVELADGAVATAHIANTGSMRACTAPRAPVRLSWSDDPKRKLPWSVEQIQVDGRWIVVNTARPNAVVAEALAQQQVPELAGYEHVQREVVAESGSRLDVCLTAPGRRAWVEVKNATLVEGGAVRFPDAVTTRGTRHAELLERLVRGGDRAVLFFHVGTEGGEVLRLADDIDPTYAAAVRAAARAGVEVLAYRCAISATALTLGARVDVQLVTSPAP